MKLDKEFIKDVLIQYIAMVFSIFSLIAVVSLIFYLRLEMPMVMLWEFAIFAALSLIIGISLIVLYYRRERTKEEAF